MSTMTKWIDEQVKNNDIILFMKGSPEAPKCGFSLRAVQILNQLNVPYKTIDVLESDELRLAIKQYADWPTIPQLYIKGEFVGGSDIMTEMFQEGELKALIADKIVKA